MIKHETLKEIIEAAGYDTRSYSGRGMFGRECLAVSIDVSESEFFSDLIDVTDSSNIRIVSDAMRNVRTDSLGRGTILYFPSVPA